MVGVAVVEVVSSVGVAEVVSEDGVVVVGVAVIFGVEIHFVFGSLIDLEMHLKEYFLLRNHPFHQHPVYSSKEKRTKSDCFLCCCSFLKCCFCYFYFSLFPNP